jgi:hypothetical protein
MNTGSRSYASQVTNSNIASCQLELLNAVIPLLRLVTATASPSCFVPLAILSDQCPSIKPSLVNLGACLQTRFGAPAPSSYFFPREHLICPFLLINSARCSILTVYAHNLLGVPLELALATLNYEFTRYLYIRSRYLHFLILIISVLQITRIFPKQGRMADLNPAIEHTHFPPLPGHPNLAGSHNNLAVFPKIRFEQQGAPCYGIQPTALTLLPRATPAVQRHSTTAVGFNSSSKEF